MYGFWNAMDQLVQQLSGLWNFLTTSYSQSPLGIAMFAANPLLAAILSPLLNLTPLYLFTTGFLTFIGFRLIFGLLRLVNVVA